MEKKVIYDDYVVYTNGENPLKISEIIDTLTKLKEEVGDGYLWKWDDGIMKTIKTIGVRTSSDKTEQRVELSL
ncbi:MAG: hypothetical protein IJ889_06380 [Eubacterium sp.]|nr:hypothetical protein [Eubacterium sp.]